MVRSFQPLTPGKASVQRWDIPAQQIRKDHAALDLEVR